MNQQDIFRVLLKPHISEKAAMSAQGEKRQYVFQVTKAANKPLIKQAVEELFAVKVSQVRVVNVNGHTVGFRQKRGRRSDWKKAYVTLQSGYEIDLAGQS